MKPKILAKINCSKKTFNNEKSKNKIQYSNISENELLIDDFFKF